MNKITNILIVVLLSFSFFSYFYVTEYSMGVCNSFSINEKDSAETKLLIVSQQSTYKDELSDQIINKLKHLNIYIELIDLTKLNPGYTKEFDAVIIMHTWEINRPPNLVKVALSEIPKNKVFTISTSGSGDNIIAGVDGISSASRIIDIDADADKAVTWFKNLNGHEYEIN